jgi:ubiquinone/menaquinone biosynthesis C-methylase UbiE
LAFFLLLYSHVPINQQNSKEMGMGSLHAISKTVSVYDKICDVYSETFNKPGDHVDEFLNLVPENGKILDIGCGPGIDADYMASSGFRVTALDYSREMINLAAKRNPNVIAIVGDMRKVEFASKSFDGIFASYSLIHIPRKDVLTTLQKFYNFLKPNGTFYCSLQEGVSQEIVVNTPLKENERIFLNIISASETKELIREAGFSIVQEFKRNPKPEKELNFRKYAVLARKNSAH